MWKPVSSLALPAEPPRACEQGRSCFCKEIVCKNVYKNISVKITRSKEQVYLWCHSTWGILTGCEKVATAVSLHPVPHVEQSSDKLPPNHSCHSPTSYHPPTSHHLPTSPPYPQYPYKGNHTSVCTPRYTCNISCGFSKMENLVTMTYECTEPSSTAFPLMALYVTCSSGAPSATIASSREPLEIKHKEK